VAVEDYVDAGNILGDLKGGIFILDAGIVIDGALGVIGIVVDTGMHDYDEQV